MLARVTGSGVTAMLADHRPDMFHEADLWFCNHFIDRHSHLGLPVAQRDNDVGLTIAVRQQLAAGINSHDSRITGRVVCLVCGVGRGIIDLSVLGFSLDKQLSSIKVTLEGNVGWRNLVRGCGLDSGRSQQTKSDNHGNQLNAHCVRHSHGWH